ncbi:outer membrane protein assembly factor BamB family protein [Haloarchaeobius iranensis]|uniref:Outer membrane protein assembly factor BamB, contains PQQ-like beta-propeller repeat n=1 Tax=Haloarchaeobius iranensis TaxID=996166 RepID=A0A1G9UB37_9EURY|nr:PQQ-binding-like beta-propeller repeat protein [Haloarchaeobius iranensis]SDM57177.1 Outer membrane protein assembly factor BamB, contains PQQ-like beta-propeller repeat [Haloarchaeobius iranensis]
MSGYAEVAAFELPSVTASDGGVDDVALVGDGDLTYVRGTDRTTLPVDAEPVDVALGERVYVLTADALLALSPGGSGSRVWSLDLGAEGVEGVAALPDEGVVCVLTERSLVGVDGESGSRRWTVDRPYADVAGDVSFVAADGRFLLGAWSFVTGVDAEGEQVFDADLGSALTGVGGTGGTVVAALKSDQLVGVDPTSGSVDWRTEIRPTQVTPRGDETLLVRTADGLLAVQPDGTYESVDGLPAGSVYPARNGDLVCVYREDTLSVHRRSADVDAVTATLPVDAIGPGEPLVVELTNEAETAGSTTVTIAVEGATTARRSTTVDLPAGGSTAAEFEVTDVEDGETAEVSVSADGVALASESIAIDRPDPPEESVAAELTVDRVEGATVHATLFVHNEGEVLQELRVREDDLHVGAVAPGETSRVEVTERYTPGESVERTVVDDAGATVATASTSATDGSVTVSVEPTVEGSFLFVDVTVENPTETKVADSLVLLGVGDAGPVERAVDVAPGATWTLSVALPGAVAAGLDGNVLRVRLDGAGVEDTHDLTLDNSFAAGAAPGGRDQRAEAPTGADRGQPAGGRGGQARQPGGGRQAGRGDTPGGSAPPAVSLRRAVADDEPAATEAFLEYLAVDTEGQTDDLTLVADGEQFRLGSFDRGEERRYQRAHALARRGRSQLPPVAATADGGHLAETGAMDVDVRDGPLVVRASVDASGPTVRVRGTVENRTDDYLSVEGVDVTWVGAWDIDPHGEGLAPGETVRWSGSVPAPETELSDTDAVVPLTVEYGGDRRFQSLATVERDAGPGTAVANRLDPGVGRETHVADTYSKVVCNLRNVSEEPIQELQLAATGERLNEMIYVEETVQSLQPGETVEHFVDVKPAESDRELAVDLLVTCDGETDRLALDGPVAATPEEWSRSHLEGWTATWEDDEPEEELSVPVHLSTPFEQTD